MRSSRAFVVFVGAMAISAVAAAQDSPAPPRSIRDIKALIDAQPRPARADIAVADGVPPSSANAADLAKFYRTRAMAAYAAGRDAQALADHHLALAKAREANLDLAHFLISSSAAERDIGNFLAAKELAEEHLRREIALNREPTLPYKNIILSLLRLGDLAQAETYQRDNEKWLRKLENGLAKREVLPGLRSAVLDVRARYLLATGRLPEAEAASRSSISELETMISEATKNPGRYIPVVLMQEGIEIRTALVGEILAKQGRLVEAEIEARRALERMLKRGVAGGVQASTLLGFIADVMIEQGRFGDAEAMARESETVLAAVIGEGARAGALAGARMRVAQVLALRGKTRRAGEMLTPVIEMQEGDATKLLAFAEFDPILLAALARSKQGPAAEAVARSLLDRRVNGLGERAYSTAEARGFLGAVLWMQGKNDEALAAFRQAIPILLAQAARAEDQIANGIRLQSILEAYLALLFELKDSAFLRGTDIAAETFQLAEATRGRSVQRAIAASAARAAAHDPTLSELARREQDLGQRVAGLHQTLKDATLRPSDQQIPGAQAALRRDIAKLTEERASLVKEIAKRFPGYGELVDPMPVTLGVAKSALKPDEVLVTFLVGIEQSYVWAVSSQGDSMVSVVKQGAGEVAEVVAKLRYALDPQARGITDIPRFDVGTAHRLYLEFLSPIAPVLSRAKSLLVVTHGPFGQLPLGLLVTEKPPALKPAPVAFAEYRPVAWLARSMSVTQLPSVATFVALRKLPASKPGRLPLIAFGDPVFALDKVESPTPPVPIQARGQQLSLRAIPGTAEFDSADLSRLPRLPDTADEINEVAAALGADPTRDLFLGPRATEDNVMNTDLSKHRVVMFATHGLVPGDLDGLRQPALALSSPKAVGGKGNGLLTMEKILRLKLDADWVVLSACNTASAAGDEGAESEALSGLARAFFYAGARTLLVTNWPVESSAATAITTGLFKRQAADRSLSRAEAMRQSMLAMIDGGVVTNKAGKPIYSYAHPLFWAPFSLVGDGWSDGKAN